MTRKLDKSTIAPYCRKFLGGPAKNGAVFPSQNYRFSSFCVQGEGTK